MPTPVVLFSTRLPADLSKSMDKAARAAKISKNTWIVQAVKEKLEREAKT